MPKKSKYSDRANEVIRKVLSEMPPHSTTKEKLTALKAANPFKRNGAHPCQIYRQQVRNALNIPKEPPPPDPHQQSLF